MDNKVDRYYIPRPNTCDIDPITVYVEDHEGRSGRAGMITAVCFGEAWSAYFGSINQDSIAQFVAGSDAQYLAGKFSNGVDTDEPDYDELCKGTDLVATNYYELGEVAHLLDEKLDYDWRMDMPRKSNPKYEYIVLVASRVIEHLKQAVKNG